MSPFHNKKAALLGIIALLAFALSAVIAQADEKQNILQSLSEQRAFKTQAIEDPAGAMDHFYAALARTAAKKPGAMTRIAHFGDDLIEKELFSGPFRRRIQEKWGDGGHGFVLGSRSKPWYRPKNVFFKSSNSWISFNMTETNVRDRCFGLGGATATAFKAGAEVKFGAKKTGRIGKKVSRFEILFPQEPTGGSVEIELDGKKYGILNTKSDRCRDSFAEILVPEGYHRLQLKATRKNIRIFGAVLEAGAPGVVYDALGVGESGVGTFLSVDETHWQNQLRHRRPNLVIIGVGANDVSETFNASYYRLSVKTLIDRIKKALPDSSILIMGPLDKGEKDGDKITTHKKVPGMVAAQREAAADSGAAFWSAYDAMGGKGSMARWYEATPRLGAGDLFLPTPKGGKRLAEMFYSALMQGFAEYLEKNPVPINSLPAPPEDSLAKVEIQKTP